MKSEKTEGKTKRESIMLKVDTMAMVRRAKKDMENKTGYEISMRAFMERILTKGLEANGK